MPETQENQLAKMPAKMLAWLAALLVSLLCFNACFILFRSTRVYRELFNGLGIQIPLVTRFLLVNYFWLYPLLFGGIVILLITKVLTVREPRHSLAVTGIIFGGALLCAGLANFVLQLPMADLIQKLGGSH